jgi:hypothetical protein
MKLKNGRPQTGRLRSSRYFGNKRIKNLLLGAGSDIISRKWKGKISRSSQYRLRQAQQWRCVASTKFLRGIASVSRRTASLVFIWPF